MRLSDLINTVEQRRAERDREEGGSRRAWDERARMNIQSVGSYTVADFLISVLRDPVALSAVADAADAGESVMAAAAVLRCAAEDVVES